MQLVIDIPEELYEKTKWGKSDYRTLRSVIMRGKPLPACHGRLIDADYLKDVILLHSFHGSNKYIVPYSDRKGYRLRDREVLEGIINAPTIIEADGGDTE